ncbi:MAG TPA: Xaa-Pro peptidase family protein [bacterium]|nr:Xaa-Pro peptidase family protein [bacterium]
MPVYEAKVPYGPDARRPWRTMPFPQSEYERRIAAVQARLQAEGLAALVAYSNGADPGNARYLVNFETSAGDTIVVIPAAGMPMLTTNWLMHGEPMHTSIWTAWLDDVRGAARLGFDRNPETSVAGHAADRIQEAHAASERIGYAGSAILPHTVMVGLEERLPRATWIPADHLLMEIRSVKSPPEIETMRRAARISGRMHEEALRALVPGAREFDVASRAHAVAFAEGADALAFESAVSTGPRSGLKHCAPSDRVVEPGDMVFLDMAATYHGYSADVSRSTVVGTPSAEQRRFLDTGLEMFEACLAKAGPGVPVQELIATARAIAARAGYDAEYMPKGFGHGLGCSLFERPSLRPSTTDILTPGNTFALEPMLIRMNFGTACIEETVLITPTGAEALSGCPLRVW